MLYFMVINGAQAGPFDRSALKANGLTADTYVWREGMNDWIKAGNLQELSDLFYQPTPPPVPRPVTPPPLPVAQPVSRPVSQNRPITQQYATVNRQKYYLNVNGKVTGPFDKIELTRQEFNSDSMIASVATPDSWVKATAVPEIAALIGNAPAPGARPPLSFYIALSNGALSTTNAHLMVFDDYIVTVPQAFMSAALINFKKGGYVRQFFGLEEIVGLKKGFAARKYILLSDGRKLTVGYNKKTIFEGLIQRQNEFFASRGIAHTPIQPQ